MMQKVLSGKRHGPLRNQFYYKATGPKCNCFCEDEGKKKSTRQGRS